MRIVSSAVVSVLFAAVSLSLFAAVVRAEDAMDPEMVAAVKATTVFIKIDVGGFSGSGSGFVIKTEGDCAYVVTNHHVVEPRSVQVVVMPNRMPGIPRPLPRGPFGPRAPYIPPQITAPGYTRHVIVRSFKNATVTVVFNGGTKKEEAIKGEVLAADPELDLAVIKVSGVKKLPKPIDYLHETKLVETMPVFTFGYPFGAVLSTSKGSPAITVGKGSISSLRLDDNGNLAVVQIDGAMNPGSSGGPVVDSHGRLVGIAKATIRSSSGIGLAIPSRAITQILLGRVGTVSLRGTQDTEGVVTMHVEAGLIDPMNKIKSATLHYLVASSAKNKLKPTDPLEPLPNCRKLPLKIEKQIATGDFTLQSGDIGSYLSFQAVFVNDAGKKAFTNTVVNTIKVKPADKPKTATKPSTAGPTAKTTSGQTTVPPGGDPAK